MTKVADLTAREILDSRGEKTVEVTATLSSGAQGVVSVPQGKSTGFFEARYVSVPRAIENIQKNILPALADVDIASQEQLD